MYCSCLLFLFGESQQLVTAIHNMGYGLIVCELTLINLWLHSSCHVSLVLLELTQGLCSKFCCGGSVQSHRFVHVCGTHSREDLGHENVFSTLLNIEHGPLVFDLVQQLHCSTPKLALRSAFIVQPLDLLCFSALPNRTWPDVLQVSHFLCVDDLWKLQIVDCSKMNQFLFNGNIWLGMGKMIRDSSVKNLSRAKVQVTLPVSTAFQLNWGLN